jgi:hypothetical protein
MLQLLLFWLLPLAGVFTQLGAVAIFTVQLAATIAVITEVISIVA